MTNETLNIRIDVRLAFHMGQRVRVKRLEEIPSWKAEYQGMAGHTVKLQVVSRVTVDGNLNTQTSSPVIQWSVALDTFTAKIEQGWVDWQPGDDVEVFSEFELEEASDE